MKKVVSCRDKNLPKEKMMVWLKCLCSSKGLTPLLILDENTVDHSCYIKNVLAVAFKYGNEVFGDKWIFRQDGENPHCDHLTQEWCQDNSSLLIDKNHWPRNSSNLNPMNDSN